MPALTLSNLWLFAAQAALLVGAAALLLEALQPTPAFRLAACRAVLVTVVLLPLQVLLWSAPAAAVDSGLLPAGVALRVDGVDARPGASVPWAAIVGGGLLAGAALRGLWLIAGLLRLRRLAGRLPVASDAADIAALQARLGTDARVCFADGVAQPVTFGIAPAIVLLPDALARVPPEQRQAIVCHELLHVRRRDWLWVIAEEAVLALLWFHPAVWWLVGELQLAREQVVDRLTVSRTGRRRAYMDTLLAAADAPPAPPLLAGFLRRRHLSRRLVSLAEEVVMSRARLVAGGVLVAAVLVAGSAVGLAAWPMAPMPLTGQARGEGVAPRASGSVPVVHSVQVPFPAASADGGFAEVLVEVEATVDADGAVTAARTATVTVHGGEGVAVSVPAGGAVEAAVTSAVDTIRQWRLAPPATAPATVLVRVRFDAATRQATSGQVTPLTGYDIAPVLRVGGLIKPPTRVHDVRPIYPQAAMDAGVQGVVVVDAIVAPDGTVSDVTVMKSIPMLDQAAVDAVEQWRFEPTLLNGRPVAVQITTTVNFTLKP